MKKLILLLLTTFFYSCETFYTTPLCTNSSLINLELEEGEYSMKTSDSKSKYKTHSTGELIKISKGSYEFKYLNYGKINSIEFSVCSIMDKKIVERKRIVNGDTQVYSLFLIGKTGHKNEMMIAELKPRKLFRLFNRRKFKEVELQTDTWFDEVYWYTFVHNSGLTPEKFLKRYKKNGQKITYKKI